MLDTAKRQWLSVPRISPLIWQLHITNGKETLIWSAVKWQAKWPTFFYLLLFSQKIFFLFLSEMIWYFIFLFLVCSRISLLSLFILKNVTCIKHLCIETHMTLDVHRNTDIHIGMVKSSRNEIFPQLWSDKQI